MYFAVTFSENRIKHFCFFLVITALLQHWLNESWQCNPHAYVVLKLLSIRIERKLNFLQYWLKKKKMHKYLEGNYFWKIVLYPVPQNHGLSTASFLSVTWKKFVSSRVCHDCELSFLIKPISETPKLRKDKVTVLLEKSLRAFGWISDSEGQISSSRQVVSFRPALPGLSMDLLTVGFTAEKNILPRVNQGF